MRRCRQSLHKQKFRHFVLLSDSDTIQDGSFIIISLNWNLWSIRACRGINFHQKHFFREIFFLSEFSFPSQLYFFIKIFRFRLASWAPQILVLHVNHRRSATDQRSVEAELPTIIRWFLHETRVSDADNWTTRWLRVSRMKISTSLRQDSTRRRPSVLWAASTIISPSTRQLDLGRRATRELRNVSTLARRVRLKVTLAMTSSTICIISTPSTAPYGPYGPWTESGPAQFTSPMAAYIKKAFPNLRRRCDGLPPDQPMGKMAPWPISGSCRFAGRPYGPCRPCGAYKSRGPFGVWTCKTWPECIRPQTPCQPCWEPAQSGRRPCTPCHRPLFRPCKPPCEV